jgi:uncharacterized protein (TIGR03435 family)
MVKVKPRATLLFLSGVLLFGQTPPAFEVASVKPAQPSPGDSSSVKTDAGRVSARYVTLKRLMRGAYNLPEAQIVGAPKWAAEERYDIDAKAAGPAGDHEMMVMMQALLAERFKLVFHRETRPLPGYALVVAKGGVTAKPSAPGTPSSSTSTNKTIDATGCGMGLLALKLSEVLHLPVSDATAIDGAFDFHLEWTPENLLPKTPSDATAPGLSIFDALQEHLGLKLEARKVPTEVLVIDSAERPSAN